MIKNTLMFALLWFFSSTMLFAEDTHVLKDPQLQMKNSSSAAYADWRFSGRLTADNGESYAYFFLLERRDTLFHVEAALIDKQSKKRIMHYDHIEKIQQDSELKWQVGRAFLYYNPVNASWSLGVSPENNLGFNIKLDNLKKTEDHPEPLQLKEGLYTLVTQSNRVNGHILQADAKELFVTANHSWLSRTWLIAPQTMEYQVQALFCDFNDGQAFYSLQMKSPHAKTASASQWLLANGNKKQVSQFVKIKSLSELLWQIQIPVHKTSFQLENLLAVPSKEISDMNVVGFTQGALPGFCYLTKELIERTGL